MTAPTSANITRLLIDWRQGDEAALAQLMPIVYAELRKLARRYLRRERSDHTLQPTALIHEAYLKLVDQELPTLKDRAHFYGIAARLMRQVLIDHARRHQAAKRGAEHDRIPIEDTIVYSPERAAEFVALDEALQELAGFDERKSRVVELRFFGGLSLEEIAEAMGISVATVGRELRMANAWLHRKLSEGS